jgi:hypothetical protein
MTDRQKSEFGLFARTLFRSGPIGWGMLGLMIGLLFALPLLRFGDALGGVLSVAASIGVASWFTSAWYSRGSYRFRHTLYPPLWRSLCDRVSRFDKAYARSPRAVKEALSETPASVRRLLDSMYMAMLRADAVRSLLRESEPAETAMFGFTPPPFPTMQAPPEVLRAADPQARSLYGIAEKNQEEYRRHYQKLMAGVERTEAQAAVMNTALDSLRIKMLDYRVTGGKVEMPSSELVSRLGAYQSEFAALEKAVDEVETLFTQG